MKFILDTDVLSDRRRRTPDPAVSRWLNTLPVSEIATAVVSITEIQRGIERSRKNGLASADRLTGWLEAMLAKGAPKVLAFDTAAARVLGRMYETPALRHFMITDPRASRPAVGADLGIAAIAIANGAVVASRNIRHFLQIHAEFPLPGLFDPAAGAWHVAWTAP